MPEEGGGRFIGHQWMITFNSVHLFPRDWIGTGGFLRERLFRAVFRCRRPFGYGCSSGKPDIPDQTLFTQKLDASTGNNQKSETVSKTIQQSYLSAPNSSKRVSFSDVSFPALPFLQAAVEGETGDEVVVKQMTKEEKAPPNSGTAEDSQHLQMSNKKTNM